MQRLRERIDDRQLYVAVVGEFNAGKSTFINALLCHPDPGAKQRSAQRNDGEAMYAVRLRRQCAVAHSVRLTKRSD